MSVAKEKFKEKCKLLLPEIVGYYGIIRYAKLKSLPNDTKLWKDILYKFAEELDNDGSGLLSGKQLKEILNEQLASYSRKNSPFVKITIANMINTILGEELNDVSLDKAVEFFFINKDRFFRSIISDDPMDLYSEVYAGIDMF